MLAPQKLDGTTNAAKLLADAIEQNKKIMVVADYDCDGATACAVAIRGLRAMGAKVDYIVPDRFIYGYGLTPEIVDLAARHSPEVILTVDNGMASIEGVKRASELGIDVIITDHHLPGQTLPAAQCIVNPNTPGCAFPSKNLAGVGVMFYVLMALRAELRTRGRFNQQTQPKLNALVDLVALGTVADVVKLDRNNRILVEQGLNLVRRGLTQPGLAALFEVAGRPLAQAKARDFGFVIAPRINAAGRLDLMNAGIECLISDDPAIAKDFAIKLDEFNRERRELLLVCASGDVPYWKSTPAHPLRIVATRASWDRKSDRWIWEQPADLTERFYQGLFGGRIGGLFMGSGRICQSRQIKTGRYYRLYAALCTHRGNFVVYSDDFGRTWDVLGSATQSCAPKGDEPKCEELPDGSVLLSSRKQGGRYFNIFRYTDTDAARGVWGAPVDSKTVPGGIRNEGGACNGEILILPVRDAAGSRTWLALQSIPAGPARSHVTLYWKELAGRADYLTPLAFASDWEGSYEVTDKGSGYSTMTLQADGRIGFFYEEEPGAYQMVYRALDLADVTGGRFRTE